MTHVPDEAIRLAIFEGYAETGKPPTRVAIGTALGLDSRQVEASMARLHDARHIVIGADGEIMMAHPFSSVPPGFSVMGRETLWWGGCAWDAFSIPHLVPNDSDVLVATQCPGCAKPLAWVVDRQSPPVGDEVAHFLVPMARVWDDVVHTCANQRLF